MAYIKEYPPPRVVSLLQLRDALYSPAPQKWFWYPNWQELVHTKEFCFSRETRVLEITNIGSSSSHVFVVTNGIKKLFCSDQRANALILLLLPCEQKKTLWNLSVITVWSVKVRIRFKALYFFLSLRSLLSARVMNSLIHWFRLMIKFYISLPVNLFYILLVENYIELEKLNNLTWYFKRVREFKSKKDHFLRFLYWNFKKRRLAYLSSTPLI